jgi:carbon-monoxide dehydrogenase large subunit
MTIRAVIGDTPRRREDARFTTGQGGYLDDLRFDDVVHAVVLRSPHAHARIERIDAGAARAMPGVLAVLTAADALADGLQAMRPTLEANVQTGERFAFAPQPLLATDKVRHVGEPVALIVAATRAQALDASESIVVEYDPLPVVTSADAARRHGAPQISDEVPGNVCMDWQWGDAAAVDAAFAAAAHVVSVRLDNHRIVTNPMEPRGAVGLYEAERQRYTLHVSSQNIHGNRDATARALGVTPAVVRFVAPDVGGGFGAKNFTYAEHALILWAAKFVGRPVKWIATRSEGFVSDHQARDHQSDASLGLDADGRFLALRVNSVANIGAYMAGGAGAVQTNQYVNLQGSIYIIPAIALRVVTVLSNTTPIGVTRGPGFAEAVNIIERLIDAAARQCGFDRIELRRRNMAAAPMSNALGFSVDSGDFVRTFDRAMIAADVAGFAERRADSEARGLLRGLGFVYHIKGTGGSPHENVDIRFEDDGTVSLITGTQTIGQGHETTFPQILADRLGIPNATIRLRQGDTDLIPMGGGHGSSRATYMGGTAIWRASETIVEKGRAIAAEMLEAAEDDIAFADGHFDIAAGCGDTGAHGRHATGHLSCVDAGAHDIPERHACCGGGGRSRDGGGDTGSADRGGRLRRAGQSDDCCGAGTWGDRARGGTGVAGACGVRCWVGAVAGWVVHGLRDAASGRSAIVPSGFQQYAVHHESVGREGVWRGGRGCDAAGNWQCDRGCAGTVGGGAVRWAGDTLSGMGRDAGSTAQGCAASP